MKQKRTIWASRTVCSKTPRRKRLGAFGIQEPSQPRPKPVWVEDKKRKRVVCPEACKVPVGYVLDCSP